MSTGPSRNLSWAELAAHDPLKTSYPAQWRQTRAVVLATEFEGIRALVGKPITIGSGYRTEAWNRKVGGARNSQHVHGRALDLYPPKNFSVERLHQVVLSVARSTGSRIQGVGLYDRFTHFDIRPARADGKLTVWHGTRAWAEVKA